MQLTLAFLKPAPPTQQPPRRELRDTAARAGAIDLLARIIAQAFDPIDRTEARND
jgi:hypothetical protein